MTIAAPLNGSARDLTSLPERTTVHNTHSHCPCADQYPPQCGADRRGEPGVVGVDARDAGAE